MHNTYLSSLYNIAESVHLWLNSEKFPFIPQVIIIINIIIVVIFGVVAVPVSWIKIIHGSNRECYLHFLFLHYTCSSVQIFSLKKVSNCQTTECPAHNQMFGWCLLDRKLTPDPCIHQKTANIRPSIPKNTDISKRFLDWHSSQKIPVFGIWEVLFPVTIFCQFISWTITPHEPFLWGHLWLLKGAIDSSHPEFIFSPQAALSLALMLIKNTLV